MSWVAGLLVMTLVASPIATAVCGLSCVGDDHASRQAASERSCHPRSSDHQPVVTSNAAVCHPEAPAIRSTVPDFRGLKNVAVVLFQHRPESLWALTPVGGRHPLVNPPGGKRPTIPLRI